MHRAMAERRRHTAIPVAWRKGPVALRISATLNAVTRVLEDVVLADALIVFANWSDERISGSLVAVDAPITETVAMAIAETIAAVVIAETTAVVVTTGAIEAGRMTPFDDLSCRTVSHTHE